MKKYIHLTNLVFKGIFVFLLTFILFSCYQQPQKASETSSKTGKTEKPEYFLLHPELEKTYGYTQAVRVGNIVKIGGVISIDEKGNPTAKGNYLQQMKNCYENLDKVLQHYGCTFDDVILENMYTTSMTELQKNASYRREIYKNHFPTGSWIGIKELGMPEAMIEIELEALINKK
ncbi:MULTISPECIES: RidA family protein [Chryseobacterium]|uniref:2-iminobutanoate/2-iminopropanoate deaminase n=1 Tax=Chryseobacterium camelliae TaxID=1265445 RepID=A0ABU0TFX2_9FLAO|nr:MULTISPECIES: RidA family protein [Chryseobacterium]MDT3406234.1 2-iminobutanoate/2-iminopropanoate deaminase [Pseudacidovorax intermedius]MDQ1095966.1 2-iminobutanoate/2-iminopropanoate deaminase [Chryseobacterium camelliae]MDQ1099902.1 2-iminobutanoate/2-iminopropanoate deaminase [Chryseobacterium sp. SORGH_AS_1048]MDR6087248.1 2-iminobutanoate/2-iminopropanoate deaminase [Chryseobacterium sp. SORGH_AS_0909]MDR6131622.1 2-iminobutanoate/2-iminopropanoate deaminase [Chryseobacterium sp. SO